MSAEQTPPNETGNMQDIPAKEVLDQNMRLMRGLFRMQEEELKLRRREQRWNQVRFAVFVIPSMIAILFWLVSFGFNAAKSWAGNYVAFIDMRGEISEGGPVSARRAIAGLRGAFSDDRAKGVLIRISSGGGSATQSWLIRDYIDAKKKETGKKVVVVGEEMLASGAYLIASGADKICVHGTTVTGSIGVVMEGWGFYEAAHKVGVEHRTFTAGEYKRRLSPFQPVSEADRKKVEAMLTRTHEKFEDYVKRGRGDRLRGEAETVFSGDIFSGDEALEYGLVDCLGSLTDVMKTEFDTEKARDFSFRDPWYVQASQGAVSAMVRTFQQPMQMKLEY